MASAKVSSISRYRYSKLGDDAFYHLYLDIDDTFAEAMKPHEIVTVR